MTIAQHHLELWPGYLTSIRQHENQILMCAEITSKVMRTETLLDQLRTIGQNLRRGEDIREKFKQEVLGAVVLTDYNNRTYRVDDVDFNVTPMATFKQNNDLEITYAEYYRMVSDRLYIYFIVCV